MRFQSILLLSLILTSISEEMNETKKNETEDLNNPFKLTEKEEEQLKYDESIGKDTSNWEDSPEYKEKMREEAEQQLLSNITFYLNEMGLSNATIINKEQFRILFKKLFGNPGKKSEENLEEKKEENKKCICHNYIEVNKDNINDIYEETELIPSVRIRIIRNENEKNFQIRLNDICNSLKRLGYPMGGSMINIYLNEASDYIFYGPDPIDHNICLNSTELGKGNLIKIKIVNYLDKKILSNVYNIFLSMINIYLSR